MTAPYPGPRRPSTGRTLTALACAWLAGTVALGVTDLLTWGGERGLAPVPGAIVYAAVLGPVLTVPMAVGATAGAWWGARASAVRAAAAGAACALAVGALDLLASRGPNSDPTALPTTVVTALAQAAAAALVLARRPRHGAER